MRERNPKVPRSQTSAPVSREKPQDPRDDKRVPRQAETEDRADYRDEDAAGGDRGLRD